MQFRVMLHDLPDLQYDGFTSTPAHPWLTASTMVQVGVPVVVEIVIADEGELFDGSDDRLLDSACSSGRNAH
jgi:hypothetical protein